MAIRYWRLPDSVKRLMNTTRKGAHICAIVMATVVASQGLWLLPESSPVERGAAAANSHGCIDCHGKSESEFPDDASLSCTTTRLDNKHPLYNGRCRDVLAYFEVVRLKRTFNLRAATPSPNRLLQGESLARQYNCFQCHGELGQGGFRNPGALKGYVPGYFGNDFSLLTRDGSSESVRTWIRKGVDPALLSNPIEGPIAEFFIERQEVSMPVFATLPEATIRMLADYVITLNRLGAMDAKAIRAYSQKTQQRSPPEPVAMFRHPRPNL